jgi:hypothetical protein
MREGRDSSGRLSIGLGDDGPLFLIFASRLEEISKAKCLRQLNGLDQKYWDYEIDGTTVVLHSDVFAGISLNVGDRSKDNLLRRIAAEITESVVAANGGSATSLGCSGSTEGPPSSI